VKGSALVKVLEPKYGDTGKEVQAEARRGRAPGESRTFGYVAGTAVTAEAAQLASSVRARAG
jgi:protein TorT